VATLRKGCEDEAEWRRIKQQIDTEPLEIRKARLDRQREAARGGVTVAPTAAAGPVGVNASELEAFLAAVAADDEQYGTG